VAFLDSAKKYLDDETDEDIKSNFRSLIRWAYLKNDFSQVIRYAKKATEQLAILKNKNFNNEDAWTMYRVAEAYSNGEDKNQAINYFKRAVELEPFNLEFRNKLGAAQMKMGRQDEARKNFQFILDENPKFVLAWINLGYLILSVDHDILKADYCYDEALTLDPDNVQALYNKAGTLHYLNKNGDARKILQRLVKLDQGNEKAKVLLKNLSGN
jgi:tetratricopeptide (TPR) repeat protein